MVPAWKRPSSSSSIRSGQMRLPGRPECIWEEASEVVVFSRQRESHGVRWRHAQLHGSFIGGEEGPRIGIIHFACVLEQRIYMEGIKWRARKEKKGGNI